MKGHTFKAINVIIIISLFLFVRSQNVAKSKKDGKRLLISDPDLLHSQMESLRRDVQTLTSQLTNLQSSYQTKISNLENQIQRGQHGGSYIIWGRKTCPAMNGTTTIYTGMAGGRYFQAHGSGSNTLCLPHNPDPTPSGYPQAFQTSDAFGTLYGSEYQFSYRNIAIDDDVPCASCLLTHASSVIMIPAKTTCPSGWTVQYNGVLTSGAKWDNHYGTEYLCVDGNPEYMTEGARMKSYYGNLFYPVRAVCGSLPCPPYTNHQLVSCVVCSI